jgi:ABC-type Mn2+/Zn2+ transport system permease subunit
MSNPRQIASVRPRWTLYAAALAAALLTGAAFAGWLDHGPQIFLSMAADAWAYCF